MTAVTHVIAMSEIPDRGPLGGAENHLITLILNQKKKGLDVELFAVVLRGGQQLSQVHGILKENGVTVTTYQMKYFDNTNPLKRFYGKILLVKNLYSAFIKRKNRVIHTHLPMASQYARFSAILAGCKYIVDSVHNDEPSFARLSWRLRLGFLDLFTKAYIAISENVKRHLVEKAGLNGNKIHVVLYGIDLPDRVMGRDEARSGLNLDSNSFVVGFVGRLMPQKNLFLLFDAALLCPDMKFLIIGEGKERNKLESYIREKNIENVVLAGYRENAAELMPAFDIFCLPSRWEGLGLVLVEAMLRHVPIVGTRAGAIPEVLQQGKYGYLADPDNADQLAKCFIEIRNTPEKTNQMVSEAYSYAVNHFSTERMVNETCSLYSSILK